MTRDEAQAEIEKRYQRPYLIPFVFQGPNDTDVYRICTCERGGGQLINFKEIGSGNSWEAALQDAERRQNELPPLR